MSWLNGDVDPNCGTMEDSDLFRYCTEGREDADDYGPHEPHLPFTKWRNLHGDGIRRLIFEKGFTHEQVMAAFDGDVPETWLFSVMDELNCGTQLIHNQVVREAGTPLSAA